MNRIALNNTFIVNQYTLNCMKPLYSVTVCLTYIVHKKHNDFQAEQHFERHHKQIFFYVIINALFVNEYVKPMVTEYRGLVQLIVFFFVIFVVLSAIQFYCGLIYIYT